MASLRTQGRRLHAGRVARTFELSSKGDGVTEIAAELAATPAQVGRWLAEAIATLPGSAIETLRAVSEIRLDRAAAVFGQLLDDPQADAATKLRAAQALVGVERDRSRLLGTWQRPPRDDEDDDQ